MMLRARDAAARKWRGCRQHSSPKNTPCTFLPGVLFFFKKSPLSLGSPRGRFTHSYAFTPARQLRGCGNLAVLQTMKTHTLYIRIIVSIRQFAVSTVPQSATYYPDELRVFHVLILFLSSYDTMAQRRNRLAHSVALVRYT